MLSRGRMDLLAATFLATFLLEVAASPSAHAGFSLDDVRRPVYRGNIRYKRHSLSKMVETNLGANKSRDNVSRVSFLNNFNVSRTMPLNVSSNELYSPFLKLPKNIDVELPERKNGRKLENDGTLSLDRNDSLDNETWTLIPLTPSISENNHTKHLVHNFLKNSLRILKTPSLEHEIFRTAVSPVNRQESLDNLILSHTNGPRPIQMYPENSPPEWNGKPADPTVIFIEDVHPSKLPNPDSHWTDTASSSFNDHHHHQTTKPTYGDVWGETNIYPKPQNDNKRPVILVENVKPSLLPEQQWGSETGPSSLLISSSTPKPGRPNVVVVPSKPSYPPYQNIYGENVYKPITSHPLPNPSGSKPVQIKPVYENHDYQWTSSLKPTTVKPEYGYPKPITVKPTHPFVHHKPPKPVKKPITILSEVQRPAVLHEVQITTHTGFTNGIKPTNYPAWSSNKPSSQQSTVVLQSTLTSSHSTTSRPVPTYPRPVHDDPPLNYKPLYVSYPTHSSSEVTTKPVYHPVYLHPNPELSPEPPPKPLVPIHPPLNESPRPPEAPYRDPPLKPNNPLGNTIIISQTTSLPPVTVPPSRPKPPNIVILESVTESPQVEDCGTVHIINDVKAQKACSDILLLLNSPLAVANGGSAAASGGSGAAAAGGASIAAGAAAAGAAAAGASLAAGAAGAAAAGAAAGVAASANVAGQGSGGPSGPGTQTITLPASSVSPVLHPLEDELSSEEEYDYEDEDPPPSSTARPPNRRPTSAMTLFDYVSSFAPAVLPFIGPVGVSLWVIILGPLSFLIIGALGVGTLIFPWVLPRIIFGRRKRRRRSLQNPIQPSQSALLFLENLHSGKFKKYS